MPRRSAQSWSPAHWRAGRGRGCAPTSARRPGVGRVETQSLTEPVIVVPASSHPPAQRAYTVGRSPNCCLSATVARSTYLAAERAAPPPPHRGPSLAGSAASAGRRAVAGGSASSCSTTHVAIQGQPGEAARPLRPAQRDVGGPFGRSERGGRRRPRHSPTRRAAYKTLTLSFDGADAEAPARVGGGRPPRERRPRHLPQRDARAALRRAHHAQPCLRSSARANQGGHLLAAEAPSTTERRRWARCRACRTSRRRRPTRCPRATTCSTPARRPVDEPALFEVPQPAGAAGDAARRCPAAPPCASPCRPAQPGHVLAFEVPREFGGPRPRCAPPPPSSPPPSPTLPSARPGAGAWLRAAAAAAAARWRRRRRRCRRGSRSGGRATCWARCGGRRCPEASTSGVEVDDEEQAPPTVEGLGGGGATARRDEGQLPPEPGARPRPRSSRTCAGASTTRGAALLEFVALREELRLDEAAGDDGAAERAAQPRYDAATGRWCARAGDAQGRAIIWVRLWLHNPRECSADDMARLVVTVMQGARGRRDAAPRHCDVLRGRAAQHGPAGAHT